MPVAARTTATTAHSDNLAVLKCDTVAPDYSNSSVLFKAIQAGESFTWK